MEKYYIAFFLSVEGINDLKLDNLINYFGSAKIAYKNILAKDSLKKFFLTKNDISAILEKMHEFNPFQIKFYCKENNIELIYIKEDNYPYLLKKITNPPKILYVKGMLNNNLESLSIVGSRKASQYGIKVAETFAEDLARAGLQIVSGGAIGIDTAAHLGAIKGNGKTVVVLGSGVDEFYPKRNTKLFKQIIANGGAVISEFPLGTKAVPNNFPKRNRIINGLSKGVLLVEGSKNSGALITVECAIAENREVYCVPGDIFQPNSFATHSLIKDGAILSDRPEVILADFGYFKYKSK